MTQVKQPLSAMSGLPSREDAELASLMAGAARLPREGVEETVRCLLRAALGYERSGNPEYLTCLAIDALVTMRLRRDPEGDRAYKEAPAEPGEESLDVEEMLGRYGL
jgi:hypothetical protein